MTRGQKISSLVAALVVLVVVVLLGVNRSAPLGTRTETREATTTVGVVGEEAVPGGSLVTEEGKVVTEEGEPVRLDVEPGTPEAPQQSNPISEESLPEEAVKLKVSANGFEPSEFTVSKGALVTLSLTSLDRTHIFKFRDPSLSAVAVGVGPLETRAITFNAPAKGRYEFFCDVPGHEVRGERGVMIVK